MTRFHLNVQDGIHAIDLEGMDLPNIAAARFEAIMGLREILSEKMLMGLLPLNDYIEITNERGVVLNLVTFADAIQATGPDGPDD